MKEKILHESGSNNYTNQDELPAAYLSHKGVANVVARRAKIELPRVQPGV